MNKRILCLLLSLIMLVSVVFTGCSSKDSDDKKNEIAKASSKNTVTLSMYLMSENEISEEQEKRIESAVNQITKSKFKIELDLRYFTEDKYYEALEGAFSATKAEKDAKAAADKQLKEDIKNGLVTTAPPTEATEATEEATIINDLGIPELAYPSISENQVDIFYVGGYDRVSKYITNNWVSTLDDDLSSDAAIIADYVSSTYLTYLNKIGMGTFMIPSNTPVGEYTYMLINKDILSKYNYSSTKGFTSLTCDNVKDLLSNVAAYDSDYLPLYSATGELDVVDITYYGVDENGNLTYDFSVMGGRRDPSWKYMVANNFYDFHNIFGSAEFKNQVRALTEYRLNGYYGTEADAEKPFAVGYVKGSADIAEIYGDDYELVVLGKPVISTDELFANGFAVSTYTSKVSRCMEVITYLNTNVDFRNLILYGIEDENYKIVEKEVDGVKYNTVERLNDSYLMDVNKTGNVTIAYPTVDEIPNIREYQKIQNRDTSVMLDLGFTLDKDDPTDKLFNGVSSVDELSEAELQKLINGGMTGEDIELKIEEGVEKEKEDDGDYINVYAMGKVAELSKSLLEEMLACESLEELEEFFDYAEDKVATDQYFKVMVNINYNRYYASYNAAKNGTGAGFAFLYKGWLDMHKLWVE